MRTIQVLTAILLIGCSEAGQVSGATAANDLNRQGIAAMERRDLKSAEAAFQRALAELPNAASVDAVLLWNRLGQVHQEERKSDAAEQDYRRALDVNSRLVLPDPVQQAASLSNLGSLAGMQGRFEEADRCTRQAWQALLDGHAERSRVGMGVLSKLASNEEHRHRYDAARKWLEAALSIHKDLGEPADLTYARLLVNSGLLAAECGDYSVAIGKYEKALKIESSVPYVPIKDLATAHHDLGSALFQTEDFGRAKTELREAIRLFESEATGVDRIAVESFNSLILTEAQLNELEDGERDAGLAMELADKLRPDDLAFARLHNAIGKLAFASGNMKRSRQEYQAALRLAERKGKNSLEYSNSLSNLAALEDLGGHHAEAERLYRTILDLDVANVGADHPQVATDLANVASQSFKRHRAEEALQLYLRAKDIHEKRFGPESVQAARDWRSIGVIHQEAKRFEEAQLAYERAVAGFRSTAAQGMEYAMCLRDYATVLRHNEHFKEAEEADVLSTNLQVRQAIAAEKQQRPGMAAGFR